MSKKEPGSKHFLIAQKKILESNKQKNQQEKRPISQNHTPYSKKQSGNSTRNTKHKRMV